MANSLQDLRQHWLDSIAMYKGEYIYIHRITSSRNFKYKQLSDGDWIDTSFFELTHLTQPRVRLGNVQIGDAVMYVIRQPLRKYSKGIAKQSLHFNPLISNEYLETEAWRKIRTSLFGNIASLEFGKMLRGEYPSFEEARKIIGKRPYAIVAIDKQFAIGNNNIVYYKGAAAGWMKRSGGLNDINFIKEYQFCKNLLIEVNDACI